MTLSADGLVWLFLIGFAIWFWRDSMRAREAALVACARACREMSVQLLDQTISGMVIGLGKDQRGMLAPRRRYTFEFSADGVARRKGRVLVTGRDIGLLELDLPDGTVIMGARNRPSDLEL